MTYLQCYLIMNLYLPLDAVRAAGGGSVNKGAQRMYGLMKQLESGIA